MLSERAQTSDSGEEEIPSITLTIINVYPSHLADAKFYLRQEIQTAEAAGAKIVVKVRWISTQLTQALCGAYNRLIFFVGNAPFHRT